LVSSGCGTAKGPRYPTTISPLALDRVVLYRNGIGYFERSGKVDGDVLTLRVRKDQVNDLLKSLTVVDRSTGKALSVSMPLDPQAWQNAALALLAPGHGTLAEMLDSLKGVLVLVETAEGSLLTVFLHMPKLDAASRAKLAPIVELRQKIGRIDTEVEGLKQQQAELDQRAEETRENLQAIKKDPKAAELRARLSKRLEEFTSEADKLGRRVVELDSKRLELKIDLEDRLRDLTITAE